MRILTVNFILRLRPPAYSVFPPVPREKNVVFYETAEEALKNSYRPCKRCHPTKPLADRKLRVLSEIQGTDKKTMDRIAHALGITDRQLRRVSAKNFGTSPSRVAQGKRITIAKNLLMQTNMNITDVAFSAGFESIRQFNDVFKQHVKMTPSSFRKQVSSVGPHKKRIRKEV
jgi:AraC family transcriptional regulator of adaptative response / DNA-3-methyladenine glycosylase II